MNHARNDSKGKPITSRQEKRGDNDCSKDPSPSAMPLPQRNLTDRQKSRYSRLQTWMPFLHFWSPQVIDLELNKGTIRYHVARTSGRSTGVMRDLRFSQQHYLKFRASWMLRRVGWSLPTFQRIVVTYSTASSSPGDTNQPMWHGLTYSERTEISARKTHMVPHCRRYNDSV
jgi:hypothetical protein